MERIKLLNAILRELDLNSYLEIGCGTNVMFDAICAERKVGIDVLPGGTYQMSSDDFFKMNRTHFDLVFIDGLHLQEQVLRDVNNALEFPTCAAVVVVHDCLPKTKEQQLREPFYLSAWTGDVWKAFVSIRQNPEIDAAVYDADWGLGVIINRPNTSVLIHAGRLTWNSYVGGRDRLLRTMNYEGIMAFVRESKRLHD